MKITQNSLFKYKQSSPLTYSKIKFWVNAALSPKTWNLTSKYSRDYISQINDLSSNNNHASESTASNQPRYGKFFGKPCIQVGNRTQYGYQGLSLTSDITLTKGTMYFAGAIIYNLGSGAAKNTSSFFGHSSDSYDSHMSVSESVGYKFSPRIESSNGTLANFSKDAQSIKTNQPFVLAFKWDFTGATKIIRLFMFGQAHQYITGNFDSMTLNRFMRGYARRSISGLCFESIIYDGTESNDITQQQVDIMHNNWVIGSIDYYSRENMTALFRVNSGSEPTESYFDSNKIHCSNIKDLTLTADLAQSTDADKPALQKDIKGIDYLEFSSGQGLVESSLTTRFSAYTRFTLFCVVRPTSTNAHQPVIGNYDDITTTSNALDVSDCNIAIEIVDGTDVRVIAKNSSGNYKAKKADDVLTQNQIHCVVARFNGTDFNIWVDGKDAGGSDINNGIDAATELTFAIDKKFSIGKNTGNGFIGDFYSGGLFKTALNGVEISSLNNTLITQFNI